MSPMFVCRIVRAARYPVRPRAFAASRERGAPLFLSSWCGRALIHSQHTNTQTVTPSPHSHPEISEETFYRYWYVTRFVPAPPGIFLPTDTNIFRIRRRSGIVRESEKARSLHIFGWLPPNPCNCVCDGYFDGTTASRGAHRHDAAEP